MQLNTPQRIPNLWIITIILPSAILTRGCFEAKYGPGKTTKMTNKNLTILTQEIRYLKACAEDYPLRGSNGSHKFEYAMKNCSPQTWEREKQAFRRDEENSSRKNNIQKSISISCFWLLSGLPHNELRKSQFHPAPMLQGLSRTKMGFQVGHVYIQRGLNTNDNF